MLAAAAISITGCGAAGRAQLNADVKEATEDTRETNASVYELLDFSDEREKEFGAARIPAGP